MEERKLGDLKSKIKIIYQSMGRIFLFAKKIIDTNEERCRFLIFHGTSPGRIEHCIQQSMLHVFHEGNCFLVCFS
jgi:hypothetical protein